MLGRGALERPRNLLVILPLHGRAEPGDLVLLGALDTHRRGLRLLLFLLLPRRVWEERRNEDGVGLLEPDVSKGRVPREGRAVVGALDDPVGIGAGQGGPALDPD